MQINFFNNISPYNYSIKMSSYSSTPNLSSNLAPLKCDTVSFRALKKSHFTGIDHLVVEKFKAPIEKFNTTEYFYGWSKSKIKEILSNFGSIDKSASGTRRQSIIDTWKQYVMRGDSPFSPAVALLILAGITSGLKDGEDKLPPVLNTTVLNNTISSMTEDLKTDEKKTFNFLKMYTKNLQEFYSGNLRDGLNKWVMIPSKENDPENFDSNVEKLRVLSHDTWCTKNVQAEPYLGEGDFHIYIENGKPKIGLRFFGDKIEEIQGELNNSKIPLKYLSVVEEYVDGHKYRLLKRAREEFFTAMSAEEKLQEMCEDLGEDVISKSDPMEIFPYFGIKVEEDEEGFYTLSDYRQPDENITFSDLGIDEKNLFKKVKRIKGDADFTDSALTTLGNLEYIGGNAYFGKNLIRDLGNLEEIVGNASFKNNTTIYSLDNLKYVGGNLELTSSNVKDLSKLKIIYGKAIFYEADLLRDTGDLEYIYGSADFRMSNLEELKNVKYIGGDADFSHSCMERIDKLSAIGGCAFFRYSRIKTLTSLQAIGNHADFSYSSVENLGPLDEFRSFDIEGSPLTCEDFIGRASYTAKSDTSESGYDYDEEDDEFDRLIYGDDDQRY